MSNSSSRSTNHGTFVRSHDVDLTSDTFQKNLSVPQKRALLLHYEILEAASSKKGTGKSRATKRTASAKAQKLDAEKRRKAQQRIAGLSIPQLDQELSKKDRRLLYKQAALATSTAALVPPNVQNSTLGYVLYEQLTYIDKGLEKSDDVVGQFVVAPDGAVELSVKSWSKMSLEFEEATNQLTENEREGSVSQNHEISEAQTKQSQYSMSLSTTVQGGGNWGVYNASATAAGSVTAAVNVTRQESTKDKQESTQKAASRARREHKLTVKRSIESGTESLRTEKFRNPNKFHAVSYKFYKAARKWEIAHEVLGVALCADVMVKNPGVNLRKILQPSFDPSTVPNLNIYYLPEEIEGAPPAVTHGKPDPTISKLQV